MSGDAAMPRTSLRTPDTPARRWTATRRGRRLLRMGVLLIAVAAAGLIGPFFVPYDPVTLRLEQHLLPPGTRLSTGQVAWLGTDQLGRDLGAQVVHGARVSMLVASSTVVLAGASGTALGLAAGYYGGTADTVIMRLADLQLSFPALLLAILIAAILGPSVLNVILILSIIRWAVFTRLAYGSVLSLRESQFVEAALAQGATHARVIWAHILPNMLTPIIIVATLQVGTQMLAEASLSFLGLGIPRPLPSWGVTISEGREYLDNAWWIATMPGLFLTFVVMAVGWFGDALRDFLDPQGRY
jgi:peptide/nickel transport system permease protein